MNPRHKRYLPPHVAAALPRRTWLALALLLAAIVPCAAGETHRTTTGIRPQDQVWLVSTRHLGCGGGQPACWQLRDDQWAASSAEDFHKSGNPEQVTVIYLHGNRIDDQEGSSGGLAVYQQIVASHAGEQGVRYVIWSWPSTRIRGLLQDVRSKASRSDDEAVYLARFLAEFQSGSGDNQRPQRVGIVAFSFGARITGGALHLLGGGELYGETVAVTKPPTFRVAFWAAGAHNDWLYTNGWHGRALPLGEKWLNLVNGCDESLRHYELLEPGPNSPALGYTGLTGRDQLPAEWRERWEEWEVSSVVGTTHNYHPYIYSAWTTERTARVVLWKE